VFVIRSTQFDALALARNEDFVRTTMDHLRVRFEVCENAEAGALRQLVVQGTDSAATYGLYAEEDIVPFLECRVVYGEMFPDGEDDDWAREILEAENLDAEDKALRLSADMSRLEYLPDDEDSK
jgi:hypothetical protein